MYRTTSGMHDPGQLSDSDRGIMPNHDQPPTFRIYQTWKGNNVFCLGGTLIFGPDFRSLFLTISLIVTPVIFFCAFVSEKLIHEFQNPFGYTIVIVSAILTVYVLILLLLTSARDPGIIPRNSHPPDDDLSNLSAEWPEIHVGGPSLPPTKDIMVNGVSVKVKYCQTCMLYRPPRCSHCSICNNCVERFDHHCPWVGQCIGKRNYRFFFMFVSSTTTLCIYIFVFCWVNIAKIMSTRHCNFWRALHESPVSGVLILYTFVCVWFVGGLTAFHSYLIFTNQTTYENFRYRYEGKTNPYNMGLVRNVLEIFCSRIPKSRNKFREIAKVDYLSSYSNSVRLEGHALSLDIQNSSSVEVGKRRGVAEGDLEDIESHIESMGGLERSGTLPRRPLYDPREKWEVASEIRELAAEFGSQYGLLNRQGNHRNH